MIKKCIKCGQEKEHHAKGLCYSCYFNLRGNNEHKKIVCKRCGKLKRHHAKGLCGGCYEHSFYLSNIKKANIEKSHNISQEDYLGITKKCILCGFSKIVELHHLDGNHENINPANLIGLCPNHHRMWHNQIFREEVKLMLKKLLTETDELDKYPYFQNLKIQTRSISINEKEFLDLMSL